MASVSEVIVLAVFVLLALVALAVLYALIWRTVPGYELTVGVVAREGTDLVRTGVLRPGVYRITVEVPEHRVGFPPGPTKLKIVRPLSYESRQESGTWN